MKGHSQLNCCNCTQWVTREQKESGLKETECLSDTCTHKHAQKPENMLSSPNTRVCIHSHVHTDLLLPIKHFHVVEHVVEGQIRGVRNVNRHIKIQQRRVGCSQKEVVGDTATSVHSHS